MKSLSKASIHEFQSVRFVLTDMDETLTYQGRLGARTYDALERLQQAGVKVIPVTAAPAGWCDQMARMWPVDGIIGENGGFYFERRGESHGLRRTFWHGESDRQSIATELAWIARIVQTAVPAATFAEDQPFRLTSIAFTQPENPDTRSDIIAALREAAADVTVNNLWVLGWLGGYDKLSMARRVLSECHGVDIASDPDCVLYVGDSTNDAPMFGFFRHSVGGQHRYSLSLGHPYSTELDREGAGWIRLRGGGRRCDFVAAKSCIFRMNVLAQDLRPKSA